MNIKRRIRRLLYTIYDHTFEIVISAIIVVLILAIVQVFASNNM